MTDPLNHLDSQKPLWMVAVPKMDVAPKLSEAIRTDVLIIGAGFTGLRAAIELAEQGTSVAIVESGQVGNGASGRTGGQVNPMLPFNSPNKLRRILGTTYFERLTEASLRSADGLFEFIRTNQIACDARQKGWLRVCHSRKSLRHAERGVEEWNKFGADMEIIDGTEIRRLSGSLVYRAGVLTPKGGAIHPMKLCIGMSRLAVQRGVQIYGDSAVSQLTRTEGAWRAQTENGSVTADYVIVATNGYTGDLIPKLSETIIPLTPIQIATEPNPTQDSAEILPLGHTISDSRRIIMYARREPDGRIVYGGLGKLLKDGRLGGYDWLEKDAVRVFPQLKDAKWTNRWGGRIAITEDHLPHLHEPKPGLLVGLGYNGRGVAMSHVMGRALAQKIIGAEQVELPFPVSDIRPIRDRAIQMVGMGTAVWFMRLLDYLETR